MLRPWDEWIRINRLWDGFEPALAEAVGEYVRDKDHTVYSSDKFAKMFLVPRLQEIVERKGPSAFADDEVDNFIETMRVSASTIVPFLGCGKVIIRPDLRLVERLTNTCLSVPTDMVRPPFDAVFIDLAGAGFTLGSINMKISGAYIQFDYETCLFDGEKLVRVSSQERCLRVVGVTVRDGDKMGTLSAPAIFPSDKLFEDEAGNLVEKYYDNPGQDAYYDAVRIARPTKDTMSEFVPLMRVCCGLCLYMSHPELGKLAVPKMFSGLPDVLRDLGKNRNNAKVESFLRGRGESVIKVNSEKRSSTSDGDGGSGASPASHWRRGHWHLYWTGPGRTIPRANWVKPIWVNAKAVADDAVVAPKQYVVE
jgi:hypothetical protein